MTLFLRFLIRLTMWTGIILAALLLVTILSTGVAAEAFAHLPGWAGLAVGLGAFPAGLAVSRDVLPDAPLAWRRVIEFGLGAALVSVVLLGTATFLAPDLGGWFSPRAPSVEIEPQTLSMRELRQAAIGAVERAEAGGSWLTANRLVWHYVRRLGGSVMPFLFAWFGVFAGYWIRRAPRADLRQVQQWGLGLGLVMSTYLAGENSYELIVLQADGPVFFAGWFVLVVPTLLCCGVGWPTLVDLLVGRPRLGGPHDAHA